MELKFLPDDNDPKPANPPVELVLTRQEAVGVGRFLKTLILRGWSTTMAVPHHDRATAVDYVALCAVHDGEDARTITTTRQAVADLSRFIIRYGSLGNKSANPLPPDDVAAVDLALDIQVELTAGPQAGRDVDAELYGMLPPAEPAQED